MPVRLGCQYWHWLHLYLHVSDTNQCRLLRLADKNCSVVSELDLIINQNVTCIFLIPVVYLGLLSENCLFFLPVYSVFSSVSSLSTLVSHSLHLNGFVDNASL